MATERQWMAAVEAISGRLHGVAWLLALICLSQLGTCIVLITD